MSCGSFSPVIDNLARDGDGDGDGDNDNDAIAITRAMAMAMAALDWSLQAAARRFAFKRQ